MRLLTRIFIGRGLHVTGLDNVPATGPVIVVGNHVATVDPPLVSSRIGRTDIFAMAKSEVFRTRFARFFLRGWNTFPVVRHTADRRAIDLSLRILREGHVLLMYPEGARSADTALHRAYPGVGLLALRSGAPVVCSAISGSEKVLPKGRLWPHRAPVEVRFGEPFTIPRRHPDGRRVTNQEAADLIMSHIAALLPESYRGVYPLVVPTVTGVPTEREQPAGGDTEGDHPVSTSPAAPAA
jgi:1-acyl-sn-glycerol-3-phosphate acyltransferase